MRLIVAASMAKKLPFYKNIGELIIVFSKSTQKSAFLRNINFKGAPSPIIL